MTTFTLAADGLDPVDLADVGKVRNYQWASGAPRLVTENAPDADGEIDTTQVHGSGSVTIGLRLTGGSYEPKLRRLKAFTHPRLRPTLTIDWQDGETSPQVVSLSQGVVTAPVERPTHRDAVIQFRAPKGVLESAELHTETIIPGAGATDGIEFDGLEFDGVEFPLVDPPGTAVIVNAGDRDAYPVLRLFGPFGDEGNASDETEIANVTVGRSLVLAGTGIAAGDYLEVDFRARTILVNGVSSQSRRNRLVFPDSAWWTLGPGVNEVAFRPDTFSGNAQALVIWRDAYS